MCHNLGLAGTVDLTAKTTMEIKQVNLLYWSALATTQAQLQLGLLNAAIYMKDQYSLNISQ